MTTITHDEPLIQLPQDAAELARCLADPEWRLFSGCLYKIMIKGDGDDADDAQIMPFRPNRAQRRFIQRLWHRNLILKARQLGFTTLVCLLWLDHALFNANQRCGIIAQDREAAEAIGSSPRARGTPLGSGVAGALGRFIPASAGNT